VPGDTGKRGKKTSSVKFDPRAVQKSLEEASGGPLSPALVSALEHHADITKWLQASPGNVAEFRANPTAAVKKHFPDVNLEGAGLRVDLSEVSLAGLVKRFPVDQATFDFFAEVWGFVAASPSNTQAFLEDRAGTIARLGTGKPAYVVSLVTEALTLAAGGTGGPQNFTALVALLHERAPNQVIDPTGPVAARVTGQIDEFVLPPSDQPRPGQ
jgi:hypothetical protein